MSDSDDLFKLFAPTYNFNRPIECNSSDWFIVAEQSISVDEEIFWNVVVSLPPLAEPGDQPVLSLLTKIT
jgi:hypothetical protein